MYMRIVWGKIVHNKWDEFETAFKAAMDARGEVSGLRDHWLARDQNDANAGYSITLSELRAGYAQVLGQPKAHRHHGAA